MSSDNALLEAAATGDREAQAALVTSCLAKVDIPEFERLALAEPFARMAAAHGRIDDWLMLAGVLHSRAEQLAEAEPLRSAVLMHEVGVIFDFVAEQANSETIALLARFLSALADDGYEEAAIRLNRLMDRLSPDAAEAVSLTVHREIQG